MAKHDVVWMTVEKHLSNMYLDIEDYRYKHNLTQKDMSDLLNKFGYWDVADGYAEWCREGEE